MIFKCPCCNNFADKIPEIKKGFRKIAYDGFEWLESGQPVPSADENVFLRADNMPAVGERRLLKASMPFNNNIGERFNALFSPAMSAVNSWEEYPDEIAHSAVVSCIFEKIVSENEFCAWIEVEITRVMPFGEMYQRYPKSFTNKPLDEFPALSEPQILRYENWEYGFFSAQGDLGEWRLIFTDGEGERHLILLYEWDMHGGLVHCGNVVFKE